MDLVVDCSICLPWVFEDEHGDYAQQVLDLLKRGVAIVPPLWSLEIVNGLLSAAKRGRMTHDEALTAISLFDDLPITVDEVVVARPYLFALSTQYQLTTYDASYLELALRTRQPLATLNTQLAEAAKHTGCYLAPAT